MPRRRGGAGQSLRRSQGEFPDTFSALLRVQGSFDSAWTSLREVHAPLRMTTLGTARALIAALK